MSGGNTRAFGELSKVGMAVRVLRADGTSFPARTRSEPWEVAGGRWVVGIEGLPFSVPCEKVSPAPEGTEVK